MHTYVTISITTLYKSINEVFDRYVYARLWRDGDLSRRTTVEEQVG